eukprot:c18174_g1_i3.p2 GENE.c18174_g1_i3~~c18174_g1_i3.p2  ORF type:complete len:154 (+),score=34.86 c18174_g1_i3:45-506(+)
MGGEQSHPPEVTAIHFEMLENAIKDGQLSTVQNLLQSNQNLINHNTMLHLSPLQLAAKFGRTEIAALLIEKGAEVNAVANQVALFRIGQIKKFQFNLITNYFILFDRQRNSLKIFRNDSLVVPTAFSQQNNKIQTVHIYLFFRRKETKKPFLF